MISGWSKLQVSLGSKSQGWGSFTLAPPSIASRSVGREKTFLIRSYSGRGGLEPRNDSIFFPEVKTTLVENLVGALINATEILDGYAHPSCVSATFKGFLGFEALSQDHNVALADTLQHGEPLQLLPQERLSHGSSLNDPASLVDQNVADVSLRLANNAHALCSVRSSSSPALRSQNMSSRGHQDLSGNTVRSADRGHSDHSHLPVSSEEDILLQEARFKAFRNQTKGDEWKGLRQASISTSDGPMKNVNAHSKQAHANDGNEGKSHIALQGNAESGKSWLFAECVALSQESSLFCGGIALSMFLAGAFLVTCRSSLFMQGRLQRSSVKRRILKSQWYRNSGPHSWGHRTSQMKLSELPKYPILEIDGDKKLLRSPANRGGNLAAAARSGSDLLGTINAGHPVRQTTDSKPAAQMLTSRMAHRQPIRQTIHGSRALPGQQHMPRKAQPHRAIHGRALSDVEQSSQLSRANDPLEVQEEKREVEFFSPRGMPAKNRANGKAISYEGFPMGGLHGRGMSELDQKNAPIRRTEKMVASKSRIDESSWGKDDELDLDRRIQKLYETIQAVEEHRRAAMLALEEERQRSMALVEEMAKQREASAVLGEEVRLLKDSHNALLASLQKKYSTPAAARTAADLVYQDWERRAAVEK